MNLPNKKAIIHDVIQGSDDWKDLRKGLITGSKIGSCITGTKKLSAAGMKTAAKNIVAELYSQDEESYKSGFMQRGNDMEQDARDVFEMIYDCEVTELGFITLKDTNLGVSPDGIIPKLKAGVEFKCPMCKTHIDYLCEGVLPKEYQAQVHYNMYVTGFKKWYFMSYYPDLKPFILEVSRTEEWDELIKKAVALLNDQIKKYMDVVAE